MHYGAGYRVLDHPSHKEIGGRKPPFFFSTHPTFITHRVQLSPTEKEKVNGKREWFYLGPFVFVVSMLSKL